MGATSIHYDASKKHYKSAREAYQSLREEAQYEYGHDVQRYNCHVFIGG